MRHFQFSKKSKKSKELNAWFDWFVSKGVSCAIVCEGEEDFTLWRAMAPDLEVDKTLLRAGYPGEIVRENWVRQSAEKTREFGFGSYSLL